MRSPSSIIAILLWGYAMVVPAAAQMSADDVCSVTVAVQDGPVRPGSRFHVAVVFELAPHWHVYWKNPGASGSAPFVELALPEGFKAEALRYPRPQVLATPEGVTYGYEGKAALFIPVVAPPTIPEGTQPLTVNVDYLVCKTACLLGGAEVETTFVCDPAPAAKPAGPVAWRDSGQAAAITRSWNAMPRDLARHTGTLATFDGTRLRIEGPILAAEGATKDIAFLPEAVPGVVLGTPVITQEDQRFRIDVPVELEPQNALGGALECRGLITFGRRRGDPSFALSLPAPKAGGTSIIRGSDREKKEH